MSAVRVRHRPRPLRLRRFGRQASLIALETCGAQRTPKTNPSAAWRRPPTDAKALVSRQTDSLSSLAGRKATFLLALIWIGSPVAGLRPMRAARLRTTRMPRPPMRMRSLLEVLGHQVYEIAEDRLGLLFRQFVGFREICGETLQGHGLHANHTP